MVVTFNSGGEAAATYSSPPPPLEEDVAPPQHVCDVEDDSIIARQHPTDECRLADFPDL